METVVDGCRVRLAVGCRGLRPGPLLFLIHGAGGSAGAWRAQINPLDRFFSVAAVDLPGRGGSEGPPLDSVEALARWADQVVRAAFPGTRPVLGGVSLGGAVAFRMAENRSEGFAGLVLVASGLGAPRASDLLALFNHNYDSALEGFVRDLFSRGSGESLVRESRKLLAEIDPGVLAADLKAATSHCFPENPSRLTLPVLMIHGDEDRMIPPDQARALAERLPRVRPAIIPGAGHLVHAERFREINRLIADFVRECG